MLARKRRKSPKKIQIEPSRENFSFGELPYEQSIGLQSVAAVYDRRNQGRAISKSPRRLAAFVPRSRDYGAPGKPPLLVNFGGHPLLPR
jgi:hypothetical protein